MTTARGRAYADRAGMPLPDDYVCLTCHARFRASAYDAFCDHVRRAHEDTQMAKKKTTAPPARATRADAHPPAAASTPPFLTADDLHGRTRFRIQKYIGLYQRDTGQTSLFLHITNAQRETFTWSVRCGSPDRISLQTIAGRNLLDWPGTLIELHPVEGSRGGRFVNLYDPTRQRTPAAASPTPPGDDDIPF